MKISFEKGSFSILRTTMENPFYMEVPVPGCPHTGSINAAGKPVKHPPCDVYNCVAWPVFFQKYKEITLRMTRGQLFKKFV